MKMFKWFNKKEEIKSQPYMPKVDDIVFIEGEIGLFLVRSISQSTAAVMDENGKLIHEVFQNVKKAFCTVEYLSEDQRDARFKRTPEEILERKINARLKPLVSTTELEHYKKVATIRDMIIKDLKS